MATLTVILLTIGIILLFINAYLNDKQHTPHSASDLFKGWMNPLKDKGKR